MSTSVKIIGLGRHLSLNQAERLTSRILDDPSAEYEICGTSFRPRKYRNFNAYGIKIKGKLHIELARYLMHNSPDKHNLTRGAVQKVSCNERMTTVITLITNKNTIVEPLDTIKGNIEFVDSTFERYCKEHFGWFFVEDIFKPTLPIPMSHRHRGHGTTVKRDDRESIIDHVRRDHSKILGCGESGIDESRILEQISHDSIQDSIREARRAGATISTN